MEGLFMGRRKVGSRAWTDLLEIGFLVFQSFALALDPLVALHAFKTSIGFLEFFADGLEFGRIVLLAGRKQGDERKDGGKNDGICFQDRDSVGLLSEMAFQLL